MSFYKEIRISSVFCCKAAKISAVSVICALSAACASSSGIAEHGWAAHGYLTPGPTSTPEVIGVFDKLKDCEEAADNWASRQVVGNPVHAECLPVDPN